jgi:hypothetical protein
MPTETVDLPPPVNHVFVDYENVHTVDAAIIGSKTVHLTLLLGAQKTKLDATVVEMLLRHAANIELIRLKSMGRNALDFALAYYLGRAALANPLSYFHIISKDTGYDPLIEHLRSKNVNIRRHDDFTRLTFSTARPSKTASPVAILAAKLPPKPKASDSRLEALEVRILEHLRKPATKLPGTEKKLVSYVIAHLGKQGNKPDAEELVRMLSQAGHLFIGEKGAVTYHFNLK